MRMTDITQRGVSLVEVLIAMVIIAIGLLGLIGLQGRLQSLQIESYQRAQALMLLKDMSNRIVLNRNNAASYVTVSGTALSPVGAGMDCASITATTRRGSDMRAWCDALQGAGETMGTSTRVGAMVGGRGCVQSLGGNQYLVTIAWQGLGPVAAPPENVPCGANLYNGPTGSPCVGDLCRRVVTTVVRIATLT